VALFEEPSSPKRLGESNRNASSCGIMFITDKSLNVSPVNILPSYTKNNNSIIIEINPESTWK
jgi:NAD-dependent SIR2 family protein deacetylase